MTTADREREFWVEVLRALDILIRALKKRYLDK
jgi:hypothetical protein